MNIFGVSLFHKGDVKMEVRQTKIHHDFLDGVITGEQVSHYKKTYNDVKSLYEMTDESISPDELMYEVFSYEGDTAEDTLCWGLTILYPITVVGECNMTRGHFHLDRTKPEIYVGFGGAGLLMYMDESGATFAEEVSKGSVHYIRGEYAHRLVNTGDTPLKVGACWGKNAGHDYEAIEKKSFSERIYKQL